MTTLKISDLSVGDWVRWKAEYGNTQIVRVTEIHWNCIIGEYKGVECAMRRSNIEPISITAYILEKNGFVKKSYDNGKMWDWWCDNVLVRKFADEDIYRFIVVFDSKHYTTMMVVGKHIHQLQHALRLAEVDKEINL